MPVRTRTPTIMPRLHLHLAPDLAPPRDTDPYPHFRDDAGHLVQDVVPHAGKPSSSATIYRHHDTCWRVVLGPADRERRNYHTLQGLCRRHPALRRRWMVFDTVVHDTPFILKGPFCTPAPLTWTHVRDALVTLHRHGWAHNDVKPSNCLVHQGRTLLADFGTMTRPGAHVLSTPLYMSPTTSRTWRQLAPDAQHASYLEPLYGTAVRRAAARCAVPRDTLWTYVKTFERDVYAYARSRQEDWTMDKTDEMMMALATGTVATMTGAALDDHVYDLLCAWVQESPSTTSAPSCPTTP